VREWPYLAQTRGKPVRIIKRAIDRWSSPRPPDSAFAASSPLGVWIDHTGRGAVEITDCNGKLCGRLVWFKDQKNEKEGCNFHIIGDVRPVSGGKWDGGWIIDPDKDPDKKYDVEITPQGDQKLKVMGYAGMKFLSETMIWTRANPDLKKCGSDVARAPERPAPAWPPIRMRRKPAAPAPAPSGPPSREARRRADDGPTPARKRMQMDALSRVITFPRFTLA
jgi:uncharacterized protein (DUF2147 family)